MFTYKNVQIYLNYFTFDVVNYICYIVWNEGDYEPTNGWPTEVAAIIEAMSIIDEVQRQACANCHTCPTGCWQLMLAES